MSKIKTLKENRSAIYTQIEELRSTIGEGTMSEEQRSKWDDLMSKHAALTTGIENEERFLEAERLQAGEALERQQKETQVDEQRAAFATYLRTGVGATMTEEREATATGQVTATATVPTTIANDVEVALRAYGGMIAAADVRYTSGGGDLKLPYIDDTQSKAQIVAKFGDTSVEDKEILYKTLKAYTYRTPLNLVSIEDLDDSDVNLESLVAGLLADSFPRGLNYDLTHGSGTNEPMGIVTAATDSGVDADSDAITYDNIVDLVASVDSAYASNGSFMMNYHTLMQVAKIKDSNGNPIWLSGLSAGAPGTILGRPYVINNDMEGIGAENVSMLFGDLKKYKVRIVKQYRAARFGEKYMDQLAIGLLGFGRADGLLLDAGTHPVKKLVHAEADA